jgi:hypothetical protein
MAVPADAGVAVAVKTPVVASGEPVTVSLVAVGAAGEPDLKPLLDDFEILHQTTWAEPGDGRREWVIALRPRRDGRLRIPPLTLGGLRTEPQWVQVKTPSGSQSGADPVVDDDRVAPEDVLLEVSTDTDSPYVQALLRYRVRVLARVPLRDATLSEPAAADALIRRLGDDRRFDIEQDGQRYRVIERLYAIVAQRPGPLSIDGPTLSAAVPLRALGAGSAPDALLERRAVISRTAADLALDVRPPPAAAEQPWLPAQSVSISERWRPEHERVRVGDPVERRIVVEASGVAAGTVILPDMPSVEGLRVYPQPAETSRREVGEDLLVTTTQTQTLVPTVPGVLRLPAMRIPWWSLGMDAPRQAQLPARELIVVGPSPAAVPAEPAPGNWEQRFLARAADDLWGAPWLALLFALAWLVTLLLWLRERRRRRDDDVRSDVGPAAAPDVSAADWSRRFERACARDDARAARDALAGWARCQRAIAGAHLAPVAALAQRGAGETALALVRDMDRHVYGRAASGSWDGGAVWAAVGPLLQEEPGPPKSTLSGLPALFPEERAGV